MSNHPAKTPANKDQECFENASHCHLYTLDRKWARETAMQKNTVYENGRSCTQICYYDGERYESAPDNLIHVPLDRFADFFAANDLPVPTYFYNGDDSLHQEERQRQINTFNLLSQKVIEFREKIHSKHSKNPEIKDCYFFDRNVAYYTSLLRNRVATTHQHIDGLQICYHDGDPFDAAPPNLVSVPFAEILNQFIDERKRLPQLIMFANDFSESQKIEIKNIFTEVIKQVGEYRNQVSMELLAAMGKSAPLRNPKNLRFFLSASRLTTVMQYASKNLAQALQQLGHEVCLCIEENDMEQLDTSHHLRAMLDFNPDVVITVNQLANAFLHPDTLNIIWWQDPMTQIRNTQELPWRKNDLIYSAVRPLDEYLLRNGAQNVKRAPFCVDSRIFHANFPNDHEKIERENKIVFIGSSYIHHVAQRNNKEAILAEFSTLLNEGTRFDNLLLNRLSHKFKVSYDELFWHFLHYAVRDFTLHWLCEVSPIPVEVYGPGWEYDDTVKPFLKGNLPHGQAVAQVYRSARYALVTHPFELNSQRLAEAAACGCIPIVYDCRHSSDQPHWEDELQFFKNKEDLRNMLSQGTGQPVTHIGEHFSYQRLAESFLKDILQHIGEEK
ncbi:MAG: hypothetical protein OEZ68_11070 [Gammaproteobacteria bacterium]|nr:hypothetical protein [Gammaproteobacteria bacterium]MDH5801333.1 hypothetical protein [Gammaproteobacteria bacterium]